MVFEDGELRNDILGLDDGVIEDFLFDDVAEDGLFADVAEDGIVLVLQEFHEAELS